MEFHWLVSVDDVARVKDLLVRQSDNPFVRARIDRNLTVPKPRPNRISVWQQMIACLLTTQQRSGPNSPLSVLVRTRPFPLGYEVCRDAANAEELIQRVLKEHGGIRRHGLIASAAAANLSALETTGWPRLMDVLHDLQAADNAALERRAAGFVAEHFKGFGPKQSRNLLQSLGLTRYEIPIDSRITTWLRDFGFPVPLSSTGLSDAGYYDFVSDGIQQLCAAAGTPPCVLDAAIFASFDGDGWTEDSTIW